MPELNVDIPEAFRELATTYHRYYVYWGGRAGGKTWNIATILILKAVQSKIKILCCREVMNSIRDSVYETIVMRIRALGLEGIFDITNSAITCTLTGSTFIFAGLFRNVEKIKSIPEITIAWINEANTVSDESLDLLIPTVREQNTSLVMEFNPEYEDDPVYKRYILDHPRDCYVKKVSWRDNPYVSQTILDEKDDDFARRPSEARHIWDGELKHYGANVWEGFSESIHVKDFDLREIKDYKVFMALDPHTSYYSAAIWMVRWKLDSGSFNTWICREWPTFNRVNAYYSDIRKKLHWQGTVADLAREFYAAETGLTVTSRYIDTRFAKGFGSQQSNLVNTTDGIVQDFAKSQNGGMLFNMPQEVNIDSAKDSIRKDLQWNTLLPVSPINSPRLYVSPQCHNVIRSFKFHRYEEDSEKETETYKDHSDCLRIGTAGMGEFRWPTKPKPRPDIGPAVSQGWMG